jgi:4-amino-4-deoxy-L-arabinose transferase-like glycosyltransferase
MKSWSADRALPYALASVALVVRLLHIDWGLPQVFEEATPLHEAWQICGWGPFNHFDPNPHFFRYPSFVFYIHAAAQALLYLVLSLSGTVESTLDFRTMFALDRTMIYVVARSVTALFGAGTVALTYILGKDVAGKPAGILAALFLIVNPLHLGESQTISVDVPMTLFTTWVLLEAIRMQDSARSTGTARKKRSREIATSIRAGIAVGLAASSKYTGAVVLVPLLAAHFIGRRSRVSLGIMLGCAVLAFAITSPFVLLDFSTFWRHLTTEGRHMDVGHFGADPSGTLRDYAASLGTNALGWPLAAASVISLAFFAVIKRRQWAWILGSFVVAYAVLLSSWSMRAERYLLPIVPPLLVFASAIFFAALEARAPGARRARAAFLLIGSVFILGSLIRTDIREGKKRSSDTRTQAKEWIEAHCPSGALVLTEPYGPDVFDTLELMLLDPDVRAKSLERLEYHPFYGLLQLPMFQVAPERSAPYYDLALYQDVDLFITSSVIRSRYVSDRNRFPQQSAFYDSLEATFQKIQDFPPQDAGGPHLTLYVNPRQPSVLASRNVLAGPLPLNRGPEPVTEEAYFYYQWGIAYEVFGFNGPALRAYEIAEAALALRPQLHRNIALGIARCLAASGNPTAALESLRRARSQMENAQDRRALMEFERVLTSQPTAR